MVRAADGTPARRAGGASSVASSAVTKTGTSAVVNASGGRILSTLPSRPHVPTRTPRSRSPSLIARCGGGVARPRRRSPGRPRGRRERADHPLPRRGSRHAAPRRSALTRSQDALVVDDVEDGQRGRRGHRVAAERAEEHGLVGEPGRDLAPGDDRADRVAVAHRLAERDEVGRDAEPLRTTTSVAGPAVPALDLVGDPQPAGRVRPLEPRRGEVRPRIEEPVARQHAVEDHGRRRQPARGQPLERGRRTAPRRGPCRGWRSGGAQVSTCVRSVATPATTPATARRSHSVTPWYAKAVHSAPRVAGERRGQPPGDVVRLGAGVHEQHGVEPGVRPASSRSAARRARSPTRAGSACSC